jgi:protein N-terminal methyltransferase
MVDQSAQLVEQGKELLKNSPSMKNFYVKGLQDFEFEHKYDCIWIQWVSSHLTDDDFIQFLKKCSESLTKTV